MDSQEMQEGGILPPSTDTFFLFMPELESLLAMWISKLQKTPVAEKPLKQERKRKSFRH